MKRIIAEAENCFNEINSYSKFVIRAGTCLIFAIYFAAMMCAAFAGHGANYYECMFYFRELTQAGRECISIVYVLPLIFDLIVRAEKIKSK